MGMQSIGRPTSPFPAGVSDAETVSGSKGLLQNEGLIFEIGCPNKTGVDLPAPQGKKDRLGGVSVHTGTIPSKTLRETALNLSGWRERGFYGRAYRVKQDISADDLRTRLHITLNHEIEVLEHQFARNQVATIRGDARFINQDQIEVTGEEGEILATGGRVLGVTALASSITRAQREAYAAVDAIDWPEGFCRRDIGWRAIAREKSNS